MVSVLLSVFDPATMGLKTDIETLANLLLKHRSHMFEVLVENSNHPFQKQFKS